MKTSRKLRRFYKEVGRKIQEARFFRGETQQALAKATALTRSSIANIEAGRQSVALHTLVKIANFFGVAPGALFPWKVGE